MQFEIREDPKPTGYFSAGYMHVYWYMKPNWLFRFIARCAGWKWNPPSNSVRDG